MRILNLLITIILFSSLSVAVLRCNLHQRDRASNNYPQPTPDFAALPFLPGIVTSDSLDFNAAFSPDRSKFYFCRSRKGKWMMYVTEHRGETWTQPVVAPFNESAYSQADPFFSKDGTLYYISNRPRHQGDSLANYDIWFIRPKEDGSWTQPENLTIVNSDSTEYYVSLADNGNLYFSSDRQGTRGSHDIYVSRYVNGSYTTPENLGSSINSANMEHDPMISPDEQFLIFTSVDRADSHGSADLYFSLRQEDGSWAPARNMGDKFNTETYEYCSYLSPDQKYLFYSTTEDVKWISTSLLPWKTK